MDHLRLGMMAAAACGVFLCGASASAKTETTFPSEHAACVAQAWVPANTDPTEPSLGSFIREQARTGEWGRTIRQEGCKL
jgi:hypothetical protein